MNISNLDLSMVFQKPVVSALTSARAEEEPEVEDEEVDLIDPQVELKEKCAEEAKCVALNERMQECAAKLSAGEGQPGETCTEELYDFLHCVDHCVSKSLFDKLK